MMSKLLLCGLLSVATADPYREATEFLQKEFQKIQMASANNGRHLLQDGCPPDPYQTAVGECFTPYLKFLEGPCFRSTGNIFEDPADLCENGCMSKVKSIFGAFNTCMAIKGQASAVTELAIDLFDYLCTKNAQGKYCMPEVQQLDSSTGQVSCSELEDIGCCTTTLLQMAKLAQEASGDTAKTGESCKGTTRCGDDAYCRGPAPSADGCTSHESKCALTAKAGSTCSGSCDGHWRSGLKCSGEICVKPALDGMACADPNGCVNGCINSICAPLLATGETCVRGNCIGKCGFASDVCETAGGLGDPCGTATTGNCNEKLDCSSSNGEAFTCKDEDSSFDLDAAETEVQIKACSLGLTPACPVLNQVVLIVKTTWTVHGVNIAFIESLTPLAKAQVLASIKKDIATSAGINIGEIEISKVVGGKDSIDVAIVVRGKSDAVTASLKAKMAKAVPTTTNTQAAISVADPDGDGTTITVTASPVESGQLQGETVAGGVGRAVPSMLLLTLAGLALLV